MGLTDGERRQEVMVSGGRGDGGWGAGTGKGLGVGLWCGRMRGERELVKMGEDGGGGGGGRGMRIVGVVRHFNRYGYI